MGPGRGPAGPAAGLPANFPFCSRRCRLVDLGLWLNGHYRIPGSPVSISEEGGAPAGGESAAGPARPPERAGEEDQA